MTLTDPLIFWCCRFSGGSQSGEFRTMFCCESFSNRHNVSNPCVSGSGKRVWNLPRVRSEMGHFYNSASHGRMQ
jgi:hypothetical protein